jgi:hypothetical protein
MIVDLALQVNCILAQQINAFKTPSNDVTVNFVPGYFSTQCCHQAKNSAKQLKTGVEKNYLPRKVCGCMAANFGEKRPKNFFG